MQQLLAIVEVLDDGIVLTSTYDPRLDRPLLELGAIPHATRGSWTAPIPDLEPLLNLLDRSGYRWSVAPRDPVPRTWAERLFAEVPPDHHADLYVACRSALGSAPDHQALLECAYRDATDTLLARGG